MKEIEHQFDDFLTEIDKHYSNYFKGREDDRKSIRQCFATYNRVQLRYNELSRLREDIKQEVIDKFNEIWGADAHFDTIEK